MYAGTIIAIEICVICLGQLIISTGNFDVYFVLLSYLVCVTSFKFYYRKKLPRKNVSGIDFDLYV